MGYLNLQFCVFVRPDHRNGTQRLARFLREHPKVELGILDCPGLNGQKNGYPGGWWTKIFLKDCGKYKTALHLCGDAVHTFVAQQPEMLDYAGKYGRVQLNIFQDKRYVEPNLLTETIQKFYRAHGKPVIVPYNLPNRNLVECLTKNLSPKELHILFDALGGDGVVPKDGWPRPFDTFLCAYAGGHNPENIITHAQVIDQVSGHQPYGLDMQSGVRVGDKNSPFSVEKCEKIQNLLGLTAG